MKQQVKLRAVDYCWLCPSGKSIYFFENLPPSLWFHVVPSVTVNYSVFLHPSPKDWDGAAFTGSDIDLQHTRKMIGLRIIMWPDKVNLSLVGFGYIGDRNLFSSASAKVNNMNLAQKPNILLFGKVETMQMSING